MFSFSLQIAIFALAISSVKSRVSVEPAPQDHMTFAKCALYVTQRYICKHTNNLFIAENCASCDAVEQQFQKRLLNHYLRNFPACMSMQLHIGNKKDGQPVNYNVFIVNSAFAFDFDKLQFHFSHDMHEPEFYFLILLTYKTNSAIAMGNEMHRIFEKCVQFNVLNVVIMMQSPSGSLSFYTYNIFEADCVRTTRNVNCNRYDNDVLMHDYLFPIRLTNFHNCTFDVALRIVPPLLRFNGDVNKTQHLLDMDRLTGVDGDLIKLVAKIMNFQMALHVPNDTSVVGKDQNLTGCFETLQQGKADFAIGGLNAAAEKRLNFTASATYHHGSLVFVLCSGLHFGPIKQLLIEFQTTVWVLIGFTIFVAFLIIKIIENSRAVGIGVDFIGPNNTSARTNLIAVWLGISTSYLPRTSMSRAMLLTWLLMTLVLRSAYQAKMFDSLRMARRLPIPRDINEVLQQEYILLARTTYDFYPANRTAMHEIFSTIEKRLEVIENNKDKFVSLSLLDTLADHNRWNYNTSNITYVKEPVYDYQHVFYFQKHSVLKWPFDRKLKQLMSAGIVANIANRHIKKKFLMLNVGATFVPKIGSRTLSGLYMIFAFAMTMAIVCFILELISERPRYVRLRKFFLTNT